MCVINGYQSKGVIEETNLPYDNIVFTCFADAWPDKIGLNDTTYFRFGQPTKIVKVPTSVLVDCLGIPFSLGDDSRDVIRRYDFENLIVGAEVLPVYNEKGKVQSISFSLTSGADVTVPGDKVTVEDVKLDKDLKAKSTK